MTKERKDTMDSKYKKVNWINNIKKMLFYLSLFCSCIITFIIDNDFKYFIIVLYILVLVFFFAIDTILTVWLIPKVENTRKTHLLSDSFGLPLNDEKTKGYYNNKSSPSIFRLGLNTFENSLFSFEISKKMLIKERCKSIFSLTILLFLLISRSTHIEVLLFIVQMLFGTNIIINWIKLEKYKIETEKIYQEFRYIYLINIKHKGKINENLSKILDITIEYEVLKARMGIMLSTKIFNKINGKISEKWESIKKDLKLK
ncbi:hypothetical protein [Staphylococcus epidermidis]|uniref:hypothetical protein n=1 Tax=Staphylococcus epidermidis TaxID=1282 RepID=UPI001932D525|nr:hypothetical protein [Staphylococcus epidermidis]MBM0838696.1 hypothetical protein [Staphylococcus epidermidis]